MNTPLDQLLEQLENVPYTSNEQELCFAAADEIRWLRKWKEWGFHIATCPFWGKQTCWGCVAPDLQAKMERHGVSQAIKDDTVGYAW